MIQANRPDPIKIEVLTANDSRESIRTNRVSNRPCHYGPPKSPKLPEIA